MYLKRYFVTLARMNYYLHNKIGNNIDVKYLYFGNVGIIFYDDINFYRVGHTPQWALTAVCRKKPAKCETLAH